MFAVLLGKNSEKGLGMCGEEDRIKKMNVYFYFPGYVKGRG